MLLTSLGILGGLTEIAGSIPYFLNAYKGKSKPHRTTWLILTILNIISFGNQAASGATSSLWLFASFIIVTLSIFLVSIPRGTGGFEKLDKIVLCGAVLGLLAWWWLGTPMASIVANCVVGNIAFVPTIRKGYLHPASETKSTWLIFSVAALLGALSIGKLDFSLLLLPVSSFVTQFGLYMVLETRTRTLRNK